MLQLPAPVAHRVIVDADVYGVRRVVRAYAASFGFPQLKQSELALVATELATNIVKHGVRGEIGVEGILDADGRRGIQLSAHDIGPPIVDFEAALRDGWSRGALFEPDHVFGRGGIGAGLGAVLRLSDRLFYRPRANGKTIVAQRFIKPNRWSWRPAPRVCLR